jgi:beta-glucosidase
VDLAKNLIRLSGFEPDKDIKIKFTSMFARAFIRGYQNGDIGRDDSLAACVKHFAAYGAAEAGREYNTVEMGEALLKDQYLQAYRAAVEEGCEMVMTAFNSLNGVPCTANQRLFRGILQKEWKFDGTVISDWAAVHELITHGAADDAEEAALKAIKTGVDIEMSSSCYVSSCEKLIEKGLISEEEIDKSVLKILKLKEKLGLFKNPYRGTDEEVEKRLLLCPEHRAAARKTAAASMVLLKNDSGLLPIDMHQNKKIALVGPYASAQHILGAWACAGRDHEAVSLYEAMAEKAGSLVAEASEDCGIHEKKAVDFSQSISIAKGSDIVILALGEHPWMSGEASSRGFITLPEVQQQLAEEIFALGKPTVVVLFNGRPLDIREIAGKADAILEAWFPGTEGGHAIADILFGDTAPGGRLTMSFPYAVGQVPVYYNHLNTGRPKLNDELAGKYYSMYIDMPNRPLYPFGYGLTYTRFVYGDIKIDNDTLRRGEKIRVSTTVKNIGRRIGIETVQMYIRDMTGSRVRPVLELKGFRRVELGPGECREVTFEITEEMLKFTTIDNEFAAESGSFTVFVGGNAQDLKQCGFRLV